MRVAASERCIESRVPVMTKLSPARQVLDPGCASIFSCASCGLGTCTSGRLFSGVCKTLGLVHLHHCASAMCSHEHQRGIRPRIDDVCAGQQFQPNTAFQMGPMHLEALQCKSASSVQSHSSGRWPIVEGELALWLVLSVITSVGLLCRLCRLFFRCALCSLLLHVVVLANCSICVHDPVSRISDVIFSPRLSLSQGMAM
jgi:hypothetical protein